MTSPAIFLLSFIALESPFHKLDQPGDQQNQHKVNKRQHDVGNDIFVGCVTDRFERLSQVDDCDKADNRGLLDQYDELVAEGGKNVFPLFTIRGGKAATPLSNNLSPYFSVSPLIIWNFMI